VNPLPDGVGLLLPKGARVIVQMHYFPAGKNYSDQTKIGLYLAKPEEKLSKRLVYLPVVNTSFKIPAGAKDYLVPAALPMPAGDVYVVVPHLLGKKIEVNHTDLFGRPKGSMIQIDDWDFNWQGFYSFTNPVRVNNLDQMRVNCRFDNSADNPKNPSNPLKDVRWGEGTEDEMCLAFLGLTLDNQSLIDLIKFQKHNNRR
jgi:hypothetical protein